MRVTLWTRLAAAWLLGIGVVIAGLAVYGVSSSRWACDQPPEYSGYQFVCDVAWALAAVAAVVAAVHATAAFSILRGHVRGAIAGLVLSLLGLLAISTLLQHEHWWAVPPVAAGYLATWLVLAHAIAGWWERGRHLTRP